MRSIARASLLLHLLMPKRLRTILRFVKPLLRAYVLAYLYIVVPKIVAIVAQLARKHEYDQLLPRVIAVMRRALGRDKFPALAGRLLLFMNVMEAAHSQAFGNNGLALRYGKLKIANSAYANSTLDSLRLTATTRETAKHAILNTSKVAKSRAAKSPLAPGLHNSQTSARSLSLWPVFAAALAASLCAMRPYQKARAGRGSLDLTLLVATRAADTLLARALRGCKAASAADPALFAALSFFIMYAWFYHPERLPHSYRSWITRAADMDIELLTLLRHMRTGRAVYGREGPEAHVLDDYCRRYGQDPVRGLTAKNVPVDCEVVHAFRTRSCEVHALYRFWRGFVFALKLYGGINAVMFVATMRGRPTWRALMRAASLAVRLSCFLGLFIALCWYGVCLARRRVLPKLFPNVHPQYWDCTPCVMSGSLLCGLSCLVETPTRRRELALFVAPRALGTLVLPEPTPALLRTERLIFAVSMAALVTCSRRDPDLVRGFFGRGLAAVFAR